MNLANNGTRWLTGKEELTGKRVCTEPLIQIKEMNDERQIVTGLIRKRVWKLANEK